MLLGEEYKNKRGKSVRDRPTECICPDELDEEGENVPTVDRAAQCECYGPIERDDRSEGRLSSGSETDHEESSKKKSRKDDRPIKKPSAGEKSKGDELELSIGKEKFKKKIKSLQSDDDFGIKKESIKSERDESRREVSKKEKLIEQAASVERDESRREVPKKEKPIEQAASVESKRDDYDKEKLSSSQIQEEKMISVISALPGVSEEKLISESNIEARVPDKMSPLKVQDIIAKQPSNTGDFKKARKSRSSSQKLQNIECDCPGICQCVICSPKIIAQRKALTGSPAPLTASNGRPCWCTPTQVNQTLPQVHMVPEVPNIPYQPPERYSPLPAVQDTPHSPGCHCLVCLCQPCTPCPPLYAQEAFLRSTNLASCQAIHEKNRKRTSVDDVFGPPQDLLTGCPTRVDGQKSGGGPHPLNCECVDCLCLPDIRRIAGLKEHPVIKDEKQVYQVKCYCENTRKPASASRIPIATNSTTGPPKAKSFVSCTCEDCKCSPCADVNKTTNKTANSEKPVEGSAGAGTSTARELKMTPSELAKLCDCQDCQCVVCFNKPLKNTEGSKPETDVDKSIPKGENKNCCCKGDCVCETCPVEQLTKQLLDASKPSPSPATSFPPVTSFEPKTVRLPVHPEDCDCADCFCPHSAARNGSELSLDHPEDCDCPDCFCPYARTGVGRIESKIKGKSSASKLPVKISKASIPSKASRLKPAGCTCGECVCPGKDAALQATVCNCPICACPGNEILISSDERTPSPLPTVQEIPPIAECDCTDCQCNPCADPRRRKTEAVPCDCPDCVCEPCADPSKVKDKRDTRVRPTASSGVGPTENKATHPPDCICDECLCKPDEKHEAGCTCPECKCVDCFAKRMDTEVHAEGCQCTECQCEQCNKLDKAEQVSRLLTTESKSGEAKPSEEKSDCTCEVCRCVDCFHKPKRSGKGCNCADCICIECPDKSKPTGGTAERKTSPRSTVQATVQPTPITHTCHCIRCTCDICTGTSSPKGLDPKKCTCELCQCSDCGNMRLEPATAGKDCTCVTCQCDDCQGKRAKPTTRSNLPHPEDCDCDECLCVEAMALMGHPDDCDCEKCTCLDNLQIPPSGSVPESVMPAVASTTGTGRVLESKAVTPVISRAVANVVSSFIDPPPFEVPIRKRCTCGRCDCLECSNGGGVSTSPQITEQQRVTAVRSVGMVPPATAEAPPFEVPVHKPCTCGKCDCFDCNKLAGNLPLPASGVPSSVSGIPPSAPRVPPSASGVPPTVSFALAPEPGDTTRSATTSQVVQTTFPSETRSTTTSQVAGTTLPSSAVVSTAKIEVPEICKSQRCDCPECNKQGALSVSVSLAASTKTSQTATEQIIQTTLPVSASTTQPSAVSVTQPSSASAVQPSSISTTQPSTMKCDCATCTCAEDAAKRKGTSTPAMVFPTVSSKSTGFLNKGTVEMHPTGCKCRQCCAKEPKIESSQQGTPKITSEEIIDISKMDNEALMRKIQVDKQENCKCREQIKELRRALDKIKCSCTEAEMKAIRSTASGKPFVKQASAFGQTMSGLKFALNNLQEKCKAKDRLIEVMTGELKMRTSCNTFDRVLNTNANTDVPDYDRADDVRSLDRPDNTTNILFSVNEEREVGHTKVRQKYTEYTGHRHKKKSKQCKCGKHHKDRVASNVDLSGFEVVDIRRITQDSIIIKWKPPQSNLINGYDIFVNGVNKSKVMSGGRTSAMVHSLDLSSTIQITIYAVTKCGRCEPPAIAIYEINT